jgi:hypothetical protein
MTLRGSPTGCRLAVGPTYRTCCVKSPEHHSVSTVRTDLASRLMFHERFNNAIIRELINAS